MFDGVTYDHGRDSERLATQLRAVRALMSDGQWRTLSEIVLALLTDHAIVASTPSVSARLRDLRKAKFGGHTIGREYVSAGLWRYRMVTTVTDTSITVRGADVRRTWPLAVRELRP